MTIRKSGAIIGGLRRADAALDATSTKPIIRKNQEAQGEPRPCDKCHL